jgi:hypothetical protein
MSVWCDPKDKTHWPALRDEIVAEVLTRGHSGNPDAVHDQVQLVAEATDAVCRRRVEQRSKR